MIAPIMRSCKIATNQQMLQHKRRLLKIESQQQVKESLMLINMEKCYTSTKLIQNQVIRFQRKFRKIDRESKQAEKRRK